MRIIILTIKIIFIFTFLISLAAGSLFAYSLHDAPLVNRPDPLSTEQITRVKVFINNNNISRFRSGETRSTSISEPDFNFFISYFLDRFNDQLHANAKLFENSIFLTSSLKLPTNPAGKYLNISAQFTKDEDSIIIDSLTIGKVHMPDFIARVLLQRIHNIISERYNEYTIAINSITDFQFNRGIASIDYVWHSDLTKKIKHRIATQVFPSKLHTRIVAYSHLLSRVSLTINESKPSLTSLLKPMFTHAIERSKSNDPVEENRALLITLGAHMLGKNIPRLLGDKSAPYIRYRHYYLHSRNDLSKHLLISSALTAMSDPEIAQVIGLEKELDDSNGGSGFSFVDLTADRAGVVLANMGLTSRNRAKILQQSLSQTQDESDFMPGITSLQEGIQEIDFKRAYGSTNSSEYNRVIRIIDQRIAQCSSYQI